MGQLRAGEKDVPQNCVMELSGEREGNAVQSALVSVLKYPRLFCTCKETIVIKVICKEFLNSFQYRI